MTEERTGDADRAAELQQERNDEIARLNTRVTEIERDYMEATQKVESGNRTATAGLREELKEDVANIKEAVNDLGSTTPENWWERHEEAMRQTAVTPAGLLAIERNTLSGFDLLLRSNSRTTYTQKGVTSCERFSRL